MTAPVGPGHEQIYNDAVESVRIATMDKGVFDKVNVKLVDDTNGKLGRSAARNKAILESKADWLFFLDADDLMHPDAFRVHSKYDQYDAVFGNIYETSQGVAVWRYQVPRLNGYNELVSFDPYLTLQMGHFVRTSAAKSIMFDESMDCGEDFKYYLELWNQYKCVKVEECLFLNRKGMHSQGDRSATGREWSEVVSKLINDARIAIRPFTMRDGYYFPSTDTHFNKSVFELNHIPYCLDNTPKKRIAIDVGAHVGGWSKELSKHFDTVVSFEASDINYRCLEKNTEKCQNVERHHSAVGDKPGKVNLHQGVDPGNSGQNYVEEGSGIEMVCLDDCVNGPVDFIKIDVEGYEPFVLDGAKRIIEKYHPSILIEQTPALSDRYGMDHLAAGRLLELWGYKLIKQMNKNYLYVYTAK